MTSPADGIIAALRSGATELATVVEAKDGFTGPSACSDWDISQVLGHLGSGAEIGLGSLRSSIDPSVASVPNTDIWDRWNAMSPQDRAAGYLTANEALVSAYEALDDATRNDLRIDLGFLPAPVDVATAAGLRLQEFALHSWDVRSMDDPAATVAPEAAAELLDRSGLLIGWIGHADAIAGPVTLVLATTEPERRLGLTIADAVALGDAPEAGDGTLTLPAESWLRLMSGRLPADQTPASVSIDSAAITLEDLRKVFPGF
jgi:uncharacterized protein (TIGR03083 family)